jgi:hypothetical protein
MHLKCCQCEYHHSAPHPSFRKNLAIGHCERFVRSNLLAYKNGEIASVAVPNEVQFGQALSRNDTNLTILLTRNGIWPAPARTSGGILVVQGLLPGISAALAE